MKTHKIVYEFAFPDGRIETFRCLFDERTFELVQHPPENPPEWIGTEFHQCPNCSLDPVRTPFCPQAACLLPIIRAFDQDVSYERVNLKVIMNDREIRKETSLARGVSSLMGLLIATCGCPVTRFFIPMGRFHLPLASQDETMFRASASFLLGQYFMKKSGRPAVLGLDGLVKVYDEIQTINQSMLDRLRTATRTDSTVNALILLDVYAKFALIDIDECLDQIRYLFEPFLEGLDSPRRKEK
jgi:hypothetical protein